MTDFLDTCQIRLTFSPHHSQRLWSENSSWPNGLLPEEGDDVTISPKWRMLVDISPPPLGKVFINGELEFQDERDYNFTASLVSILYQFS